MKFLLFTLAIAMTSSANANLVKAPYQSCGKGKICVSESTCPIAKVAKKKALYKAKKPAKQSVVPVPVVEEKPCEIIQNHFYITENIAPLDRLPRTPIDNFIRPVQGYNGGGYSPASLGGGYGWLITKEVIRDRFIFVPSNPVAPVIVPIATPLPDAIWLLLSGFGLFGLFGFLKQSRRNKQKGLQWNN